MPDDHGPADEVSLVERYFTGTSSQCEGPMNYPLNPSMIKLELYNVLKMAASVR